jgi:hypothetical protein
VITGLARGLKAFIHNVIHSSCGYHEKMNEIRGLGAPRPLGAQPDRWLAASIFGNEGATQLSETPY